MTVAVACAACSTSSANCQKFPTLEGFRLCVPGSYLEEAQGHWYHCCFSSCVHEHHTLNPLWLLQRFGVALRNWRNTEHQTRMDVRFDSCWRGVWENGEMVGSDTVGDCLYSHRSSLSIPQTLHLKYKAYRIGFGLFLVHSATHTHTHPLWL